MKLEIKKSNLGNYKVFLRRLGYAFIFDRFKGRESFVRRLGSGHYPRIHLYVDDLGDYFIFNIHLDQKRVSYQGFSMHNAEYDNEIIRSEIDRIKSSALGVSSENDSDFMSGVEAILKSNKK